MHLIKITTFIVACIITVSIVRAERHTAVVNTEYGPVKGLIITLKSGKEVEKYLGIPFAKVERFERPQSPERWNRTFSATKPGPVCPQPGLPFGGQETSLEIKEDCLNLNIHVPSNSSSLPVMLWIHGGGYLLGSGNQENGDLLATEQNVIVVSVNYRLGALGFLSTASKDLPGNYGMMDQVEALRWVNRNIQRFGGNPGQVTLFGLSAGGMSVALLMLSPLTHELYRNVIMMSGEANSIYAAHTKAEAIQQAREFGQHIGCTDLGKVRSCLKGKEIKDFLAAQLKMKQVLLLSPFAPVQDGEFMEGFPASLVEKSRFNDTNVMIGFTDDEGTAFIQPLPGWNRGINLTKGLSRQMFLNEIHNFTWVRNQNKQVLSAIDQEYTDWKNLNNLNTTRRTFLNLLGDCSLRIPALVSAREFAKRKLNTFVYQLEYREPFYFGGTPVPSWMKAYHGTDLFYVFEPHDFMFNQSLSKTSREFARLMRTYFGNFAKMGNPNPKNSNEWPSFTLQDKTVLHLKPNTTLGANLLADKVHFWDALIPQLTTNQPTTTPPVTDTQQPVTDETDKAMTALITLTVIFGVLFIVVLIVVIYMCVRTRSCLGIKKEGYSNP